MEHSRVNTALAFSNSEASAVLVPAVEKRVCVKALRSRGHTGFEPYVRLLAAGVFLLIRDYLPVLTRIVIDIENPGHEKAIRRRLLKHIRVIRADFSGEAIVFERIGKKSRAHHKALAVFRGEELPTRRLRARELLRWID